MYRAQAKIQSRIQCSQSDFVQNREPETHNVGIGDLCVNASQHCILITLQKVLWPWRQTSKEKLSHWSDTRRAKVRGEMGPCGSARDCLITGGEEPVPLFELGPPRWPEALTYYYFAAAGNDSFARMVLGYRHMHGLGVPKSCTSAVLYYQPVAEQVVELARKPGSLPYVRPKPKC